MQRALLFWICFLLVNIVYGQPVSVINLKNGLSNNYVQCMLQDSQGYMWIGTRDGLNRYNGHGIDTYKEQLPSSFIYSLLQHSSGEFWIGTSQGGISIYNPESETFTTLSKKSGFQSLSDKDVYALFEDDLHNIWIATLQGLGKIPHNKDTLFWYQQPRGTVPLAFTSVCQDRDKNLWVGTDNGMYQIDRGQEKIVMKQYEGSASLQGIFIRDILEANDGNLWLATDANGVLRFERGNSKITVYPTAKRNGKHAQVWSLYADKQSDVWATVINGGIFRFNKKRNMFDSHQKRISSHFNSESITSMFEDFNGNLWVSSHGDGVCYFNPGKYVFERHLSGEASEEKRPLVVSSFLEDHAGTLWIGTDGDGVKKMKPGQKITDAFSSGPTLSSNIILDMLEDNQHGKWFATWQGGVNYLHPSGKQNTIFSGDNSGAFALKNSNVKSLLLDSASNLWMVSHGNGIAIYNINKRQFINPASLTPAFHQNIAQWGSDIIKAKNGDVWIASHAGLFRYSGSSIQHYFAGSVPKSLSSSLVYCLYEDSKGNIWVGTNSALERFVPEKNVFENYTQLYDVPGNVKCIVEDAHQNLWISTINEIIQIDPVSKKLRHFDEGYNNQQGQFYECACIRTSSNKIYFGGTEGFNSFWPDSVKETVSTSRLLITALYLFNQKQLPGNLIDKAMPFMKELDLSHDQNVVSFEFLALNYSAFNKNLYSYKMEGFNDRWTPAAEARLATYTNLDPGHYTFRVRSISPDRQVLSETSVRINIIPPFWNTTWFRLLSVITLIVLTTGYLLLQLYWSKQKRLLLQQIVLARTKEVREKNELLEQRTADLQSKNQSLMEQDRMIREQADILAEQRDQLQQNNVALQDLVSTKNRLFSIIAHDLRNPFTSLLGFTKLLNSEYHRYSKEALQKLIRSLHHSSSSIYSLLENLLVWSKSQQNELVFEPEKLLFKNFVSEHFELIMDEAEKKNITLELHAPGEVIFLADKNMLSIVLRNLLSNALKYSPIRGKIEVGYTLNNIGFEIYVKDEGLGIDDPSDLFYVQAQKERDHNHGLGLILCKEFVERHGGTITVKRNIEKGACFLFTLPNSNPEVVNEPSAERGVITGQSIMMNGWHDEAAALSHPVVLIAEDDDSIRWYVKETLASDFQIIEAVNGNDAASIAFDKMPDVIISDMNMPGMNGVELCVKIKNHHQTSHIPFILLTAEKGSEKKVSGFEHGADDYITKPVDPKVLRARIHNILDTRKKLKNIYQRDITSEPATFTATTVDQDFIERLNTMIETRISDSDLNPDSLAVDMNMSRTGLYMKVKALTGESVSIYVRNVRLKESRKLLRARKMNVSEVAYAVGFNQLPYFTSCFKEAFGFTPTEFINGQKA